MAASAQHFIFLGFKLWTILVLCLSVKVNQSGAVAQFTSCFCSEHQMFGHIIHPDGCFCVKIFSLFVNVSAFTVLWTSRMAASEQNNNSFVTPTMCFQMVAKTTASFSVVVIFYQSRHVIFHHIQAHHLSQKPRNSCTQLCKLRSQFNINQWTLKVWILYMHQEWVM